MSAFATPEPITAIVEVAGAQVRVTATDRTDTVVRVEPLDDSSRSVKVASRTKVEYAGGQLSVRTTTPGDKNGSVAVTIDLPTGSGLVAHLAYSTLNTEGSLGASEVHLASGQVRLERAGTLKANVSSGEIAVGHVAGRADVEGAVFAMRIGEAEGPVGFSSSGGQVWIGHAAAGLDLRTAGADVDLEHAGGDVTVETAGGAIRIGRMAKGRATLRNASGNIEVGITEGVAASVDVDSERGAVHNLVSSQGEPQVSVFARTRHGDVTVQRVPQEASVTSTS